MSLRPEEIGPIPEDTARVARAAFPKGNTYMALHDLLGTIYEDAQFAALFAARGTPAEAPWRLALVTVMQFAEGLSDRQAADAVRARIDWKYALALPLDDPGFDFSVLSAFRTRLVHGGAEGLLLDALLARCKERGLLKARGRQRTDATHVLGALRVLNRLELVAETLRAALNAVAQAAPEWLRAWTPRDWFERYGHRIEEARLPQSKEERQAYAETVGADGMVLLRALYAPDAPLLLRTLPAVDILRRVWLSQYILVDGHVRFRDPKDMPPAADQIESPYEPEARYGEKRDRPWIGYKVHLTQTCDAEQPHLVTQVDTTLAPASDITDLATIQRDLARRGFAPGQHLVDAGYVRARNLVTSQRDHRIDLVGPIPEDQSWQAKEKQGYDATQFAIDWEARTATCPHGRTSKRWCETYTARRRTMIHIAFAPQDCQPCPVRTRCTRAKARALMLQVREEHEALRAARARQQTKTFAALYAHRAGIEGTLSQGVRVFGLRYSRYRGLARTHLQDIAIGAASNIGRIVAWYAEIPRATTRTSHFAALAAA
jgi:transposase